MEEQTKPIRYMMLTTQRSGSTWVTEVLGRQEHVCAIEEIFLSREDTPITAIGSKRERWMHYCKKMPPLRLKFLRCWYLFKYLDEVIFGPSEPAKAEGFKLMYNQLFRKPEIVLYALRHRLRIIHLVRHNTFDLVLSSINHKRLKLSHTHNEIDIPSLELDPQQLIADIRRANRYRLIVSRLLRFSGLSYKEVVYEELCGGPEAYEGMLGFIGASYGHNSNASRYKKMNRKSYRELIRNYAEIEAVLKRHGYGAYLDEKA